jgi:hypothetical protein
MIGISDVRRSWLAVVAGSAVLFGGCATGSTFRSGVGDAFPQHPPYYAGRTVAGGGPIVHVPIRFQRGATQPESFDLVAGASTPVGRLLAEMYAYLDSLRLSVPLDGGRELAGTPPDVMFGCELQPGDDCDDGPPTPLRMRLAVGRPSASWVESANGAAAATGADRLLVITLETSNYWPRQRNLLGQKEIELGTEYAVGVPWLTSLDDPVSALQLTGALVGRDGRAIRIGAEGLLARRTNLLLSAVGVQAMISDEDVERIRTARRDDLPGQPLVWKTALRNLVGQLTGRPGL